MTYLTVYKSMTVAERDEADEYAGPGKSFPLYKSGKHLKAAYDLSGSHPSIRAKVVAFAKRHNLTHLLPQTAKKAKGEDMQRLFDLAYHHEAMEGDRDQQRRLVRFAEENGVQHYLPPEAHGLMHEMGVAHNHPDTPNDEQTGLHVHEVVKAFNLTGHIVKSCLSSDGGDAFWEGWLSTTRKDKETDVTEPEAFIKPMDSYFQRRSPVSLEHNGRTLPIGHLQKAAVFREGELIKERTHPTDPANFEWLTQEEMDKVNGTGVWVRGRANEPEGISAIRKGNVGGMSFIASAPKVEALPGGRYRYLEFDPWIESTIAAYPINPEAVIAVSKAYGLSNQKGTQMTTTLKEIMDEAAAKVEAERVAREQAQGELGVTKADLGAIFSEFKKDLLGEITPQIEEVKKAASENIPNRGEGTGRKGTATTPEDERDADPVAYLVKKAEQVKGTDADFDDVEKVIIGELFYRGLTEGLRD